MFLQFIVYGNGKVVPACAAAVCPVVNAFDIVKEDKLVQSLCQITGAGWSAELVGNDADFLLLVHEANHGLDEVVTVRGVDPGGADDQDRFTQDPFDGLFAGEFGFAVDVQGIGLVFGRVGMALFAVEDEVR